MPSMQLSQDLKRDEIKSYLQRIDIENLCQFSDISISIWGTGSDFSHF